ASGRASDSAGLNRAAAGDDGPSASPSLTRRRWSNYLSSPPSRSRPAPHGPLQRLTHLLHPHHVIRNGTRPTRILQSDPISSSCSRSIEVFPELRQRCGTYDFSAPGLINAALI